MSSGTGTAFRLNKRAKIILAALVAGIVLAVVFILIPYLRLQGANGAFRQGRYTEALEQYKTLQDQPVWGGQAKEGYRNTRYAMAEKAAADGDYTGALGIYRELGDYSKLTKTRTAAVKSALERDDYDEAVRLMQEIGKNREARELWDEYGEKQLGDGHYEKALIGFQNSGNTERETDTLIAWGDALAASHSYDSAISKYREAGDENRIRETALAHAAWLIEEGTPERVPDVLADYRGDEVAQAVFDAVRTDAAGLPARQAARKAGEYGAKLTDTDTQLRYCVLLKENGYNLKEVYPEGVAVNEDLTEYQPDAVTEEGGNDWTALMIFSRASGEPDLQTASEAEKKEEIPELDRQKAASWRGARSTYTVRLHPELMADLPENRQAWDRDSCTSILLFDSGYMYDSSCMYQRIRLDGYYYPNPVAGWTGYACYYAYGAAAVYDAKNPAKATVLDSYVNRPAAHEYTVEKDTGYSWMNISASDLIDMENQLLFESAVGLISQSFWNEMANKYGGVAVRMFRAGDNRDVMVTAMGRIPFDDLGLAKGWPYRLGKTDAEWMKQKMYGGSVAEMLPDGNSPAEP